MQYFSLHPPLLLSECQSQASHQGNCTHLLPLSLALSHTQLVCVLCVCVCEALHGYLLVWFPFTSLAWIPVIPPASCPCLSSASALFQAAWSAAVWRFPALSPQCRFLRSNLWLSVKQRLFFFCHTTFSWTFPLHFPMSAANYMTIMTSCTPISALWSLPISYRHPNITLNIFWLVSWSETALKFERLIIYPLYLTFHLHVSLLKMSDRGHVDFTTRENW